MSDITFGPGREPLIQDGRQKRFWVLFAAESEATAALRPRETEGGDVGAAAQARDHAQAQLEGFLREHPDHEFAAFRPEHIAAAMDPTITPLFPERMSADGPTD